MRKTISSLAAIVLLSLSQTAYSQDSKVYNCEWKAMRSPQSPTFSPYNGLKDPGKVTVSEDLVAYGKVKFQRARGVPPQKRPNGTTLIVYSNGEDMVTMAYTPDNQVQIALMVKATSINLAGDCSPHR